MTMTSRSRSTPEPSEATPAEVGASAAPTSTSGDRHGDAPRSWVRLLASLRVGQAIITFVLTVVGIVRASADDVPLPWTIAVGAIFLGWYAGGLFLARRARDRALAAGWLVGLTVIWMGTVAVTPEFIWLAFSLWLLAGFLLQLRWALLLSAVVLVAVIAAPVLHDGTTTYANVIGPLVGGVFALGISRGYLELVRDGRERRRLIASLVAAQREMAALQDELARSQRESGAVAERTRLSRDIHDTIAQSVSSIGMLALAAVEHGDAEQRERVLEQIQELSREGLADTRRIVNALMPAELEGAPLAGALTRMLDRMRDETGIRTALHVDESLPTLSTASEVALLRTAQSALANVRIHARAQQVTVSLIDAGDAVRLDIVDDGRGFDADLWGARPDRVADSGYGLRSMHDRLRELGGGLDLESAPGEGTALSAFISLSAWSPVGEESEHGTGPREEGAE